jgi:hypothetical protein
MEPDVHAQRIRRLFLFFLKWGDFDMAACLT